jgi:hypothetical protein
LCGVGKSKNLISPCTDQTNEDSFLQSLRQLNLRTTRGPSLKILISTENSSILTMYINLNRIERSPDPMLYRFQVSYYISGNRRKRKCNPKEQRNKKQKQTDEQLEQH